MACVGFGFLFFVLLGFFQSLFAIIYSGKNVCATVLLFWLSLLHHGFTHLKNKKAVKMKRKSEILFSQLNICRKYTLYLGGAGL